MNLDNIDFAVSLMLLPMLAIVEWSYRKLFPDSKGAGWLEQRKNDKRIVLIALVLAIFVTWAIFALFSKQE